MRLAISSFIIILLLTVLTGCFTAAHKKDKVNKVNTIHLGECVIITFKDVLYSYNGLYKINGRWMTYGGKHYIEISRETGDIERSITHESLHTKGWKHSTKEEWKAFKKKMAEHGTFKKDYRCMAGMNKNKRR